MAGIGGPGGIGGPKGPSGPSGPGGPGGPDGPDGPDGLDELGPPIRTSDIDILAKEVAAGRLSPREAIDKLVDATATPDLSTEERSELRELLSDLVENDPFFTNVTNRV